MWVRVRSGAVQGIGAVPVDVEVDVALGLPQFNLVGLASSAVQEARVRVLAAVRNIGLELPPKRVTVNLAPADLRKVGTGFDLPIAVALLAASQKLPLESLEGLRFVGELSLSGEVRAIPGVLPLALEARRSGARGMVVPEANALEASAVEGLAIYPTRHFGELVAWARGEAELPTQLPAPLPTPDELMLDFADVIGQEQAKRALEIAAAGNHNTLLIGPPGTGKTMLARRFPSILPMLDLEEALETTAIQSVAGLARGRGLNRSRPFRSPHHFITEVGLLGGGNGLKPGEVSLAHHGVLFLDEVTEFRSGVLESLRQPLEQGEVILNRGLRNTRFPARFLLVAACNPCPCGYQGHPKRSCRCNLSDLSRYRRRLSGPLLDRIDLHVQVPSESNELFPTAPTPESSALIRQRVEKVRQLRGSERGLINLRQYLDASGRTLLRAASEKFGFSARSCERVNRVARTIADLSGRDCIGSTEVAEAIQYRFLDRQPL